MGAPDQFAKATFATDTADITDGGVRWEGPQEVGLTEVRLDGLLSVQAPARLAGLPPPWRNAAEHADVAVEIKMPGDHLDPVTIWRAELRRAAWHVRRGEREGPEWEGSVGLWVVAPHVPEVLRRLRSLHPVGVGCYAVGYPESPFLWIAANELPLQEPLLPLLVARSGAALVEFVRWSMARRPREWVYRMLLSVAMDQDARLEFLRQIPIEPDPRLLEQREWVLRVILEHDPELEEKLFRPEREAAERARKEAHRAAEEAHRAAEEAHRASVEEDRRVLRLLLTRRGLPIDPSQAARIDAQTELGVLRRWIDQAITAATTEEALALE